jgi:signal transduction histidine kinase
LTSSFWQLVLGLIITLGTMFLIWQQLRISQNTLSLLNNSLNIDHPIAEQIKTLANLKNINQDASLLDCSQAIINRFQQLTQQKKNLSIEVRKLQENLQLLQKNAKEMETQRDSAVAAPRIKSEFLSRMGDEITTPMKSVVSMLKLLSEYPFEAEPKQLLNIAKRSTRTLVDNLNNILDFSKLDANMLKLKSKEFNVRELIDDLSSELSHYANEKDLSLQASSDAEVPSIIRADVFRIKQILRNLLGNAIRFTKSGEVSLYADVSTKEGHKLLRFTIADTGIGMSPEAQRGIFDSLQQTTKLSNSSFAGRLRLIVSKNLAELMGGEIGVISEIGQGSQFWFTIAYDE